MLFERAYSDLVACWLRHENLKKSGASVAELFEARVALDKARLEATVAAHR